MISIENWDLQIKPATYPSRVHLECSVNKWLEFGLLRPMDGVSLVVALGTLIGLIL